MSQADRNTENNDVRTYSSPDGTVYADDRGGITNDAGLLRRIPHWHIVWDGNREEWRPSSAAFDNHPDGSPMSIRVRPLLDSLGIEVESVIAAHPDFGLAEFTAGIARQKEQVVAFEEADGEPGHGVVAGNKTKGVMRHFARNSTWTILGEAAKAKADERKVGTRSG